MSNTSLAKHEEKVDPWDFNSIGEMIDRIKYLEDNNIPNDAYFENVLFFTVQNFYTCNGFRNIEFDSNFNEHYCELNEKDLLNHYSVRAKAHEIPTMNFMFDYINDSNLAATFYAAAIATLKEFNMPFTSENISMMESDSRPEDIEEEFQNQSCYIEENLYGYTDDFSFQSLSELILCFIDKFKLYLKVKVSDLDIMTDEFLFARIKPTKALAKDEFLPIEDIIRTGEEEHEDAVSFIMNSPQNFISPLICANIGDLNIVNNDLNLRS